MPGVLEQAGEALAQQHRVLGDHDTHGSSTAIRVGAGRAVERQPPALGDDAVDHPREPAARPGRCAADPVVGHHQAQALGRSRGLQRHARWRGVLYRVVSASQAM